MPANGRWVLTRRLKGQNKSLLNRARRSTLVLDNVGHGPVS